MEIKNISSKRLTTNYSIIQSICIMGYCSVFSFASVFLLSRGFTNSMVGMILTIASGLGLLVSPIVAGFADKSKKLSLRSIAAILLTLTAVTGFLLLFTSSVMLPTAILYILLITFFSTHVPLVTSMAMAHINNGVPINFSLARGIGSFTFAILSFILGFLVDDYGVWVIMAVNIGIGLLGAILVATFRKPQNLSISTPEKGIKASGLIEFGLKNMRFMAIVGSIALLYISHVIINTYTIQIIQNVGGDNSDMGIATSIAGFLELPAMALFPFIYKRMRNAGKIMKLSGVFFVIKAVITLVAPNVLWIYIAQSFQFFSYAFITPASVFYVNQVINEGDKVKGQAFMGMTFGFSGLIGNLLGGVLLDTSGGVPLMLSVGIVVSIIGLILLVFFDKSGIHQTKKLSGTISNTR